MDYLLEIEDKTLGFLNQMPGQMIEHFRNRGGALDFADTKTLLSERDTEWNMSEVPQLYFNRVEKAMRGLTRAGINSNLNERRNMALFYLKTTGEFDAAVREWEAKPAADKTWVNIKNKHTRGKENTRNNKENRKQMDKKIRRKKREMTRAPNNHRLRRNITLHEPGTKLTKHRTIKHRSVPTR
jgi:hypothetical protein